MILFLADSSISCLYIYDYNVWIRPLYALSWFHSYIWEVCFVTWTLSVSLQLNWFFNIVFLWLSSDWSERRGPRMEHPPRRLYDGRVHEGLGQREWRAGGQQPGQGKWLRHIVHVQQAPRHGSILPRETLLAPKAGGPSGCLRKPEDLHLSHKLC